MEEITTKLKKWGNSYGVIIPKSVLDNQKISENSEVTLTIKSHKTMTVREAMTLGEKYGIKKKKPIEEVMKEMDYELYGIKK